MTRRFHAVLLSHQRAIRSCAALFAAASLGLSGLSGAALPGANAAPRAVARVHGAAPSVVRAPSLGPSPYECITVCTGYGRALAVSSLAGVAVTPKIVNLGDVVTARITQYAPKQAVLGYRWKLDGLPAGVTGAAALVAGVKGCGFQDLTCSWRVTDWYTRTKASVGGWLIVTVGIANTTGPAEAQDYYGVVSKGVHVLDGFVRDAQGAGLPGVPIDINGTHTYSTVTDSNGLYNAMLPAGRYVAWPRVQDLAGKTESTSPDHTQVSLTKDAAANFTLNPCGKGRCATAYDWNMPDRFGVTNANGLIDYPSLVSDQASGSYQTAPASWPATITVNVNGKCPKDIGQYLWQWQVKELAHAAKTPLVADTGPIKGPFSGPTGDPCEFTHTFPELGVYRVTVTTFKQILPGVYAYAGKHTDKVTVRDWLIAGLGDSIASGDGAPDVAASPVQGGTAAKWEYARCRRSANSYQAQAALVLEQADPKTSVTFLHLACVDASISALNYQLQEMTQASGGRVPDAVMISIGANDIGFWDALSFCAQKPSWAYRPHASSECFAVPYPVQTAKTSLGKAVQQATTKTLPADYAQLHLNLKAAGIPAGRVYLVEYPDPMSAVNAQPYKKGDFIDVAEARWFSQVVQGLNKQARLAAARYGWHYVGGIAAGFAGHGYRAPQNKRWIDTSADSVVVQGAVSGALHPNTKGYAFMAGKVAQTLLRYLPRA